MITVPSSEFSKNFGRYREVAQREPVAVTSHDRVTGYFVSGPDYEAYLRMKAQMPKAFAVEALSEETIQAIAMSKMDAKHDHLNNLLDD
ncbi:MAG: type II toxin-antitoxin system Phd/YefM family antitoxin [Rickettsiales bacterium]|nr:type II toxin-antitoxin system Phd/YefM family antitoxin [Rickettsiales bacterium]